MSLEMHRIPKNHLRSIFTQDKTYTDLWKQCTSNGICMIKSIMTSEEINVI